MLNSYSILIQYTSLPVPTWLGANRALLFDLNYKYSYFELNLLFRHKSISECIVRIKSVLSKITLQSKKQSRTLYLFTILV